MVGLARPAAITTLAAIGIVANAPALAAEVGPRAAQGAKPVDIWQQETLTGDWGGSRTTLKERGVQFTINYIGELLANAAGGLKPGATYEGRLELTTELDLDQLAGWSGATANVKLYQIHNSNGRIGADHVGSISEPSNIAAYPTTRLFTAWFQQSLWNGKASIRVGQLAADDEFLISETAANLINGTFGWANYFAANLPNGGPGYPLAAPGMRVKFDATDRISLLAAAFSGDPAGPNCSGDPQVCNPYGLRFSFSGGVLAISELQYNINHGKDAKGLPASYKLGGWYHSGSFPDGGLSTSPVDGIALSQHRGNGGVYGIVDQAFWRKGASTASFFLRGGVAPPVENLLPFYVDAGFGLKAPLPGREDDVLTFGIIYSDISQRARDLDNATRALLGPSYPVRDYELQFELTYQLQMAPWWTIQPDLQYIVHPGGNVPDPNDPTRAAIRDALVIGARSTVKF